MNENLLKPMGMLAQAPGAANAEKPSAATRALERRIHVASWRTTDQMNRPLTTVRSNEPWTEALCFLAKSEQRSRDQRRSSLVNGTVSSQCPYLMPRLLCIAKPTGIRKPDGSIYIPNAKVSEAIAREICRLSELYIDGTIRLVLAADSRAMQLSGVLFASLTAIVVTFIGFLLAHRPIERNDYAIGAAMIVAAMFFALALRHSLSRAATWNLNVIGNGLDSWTSDEDLFGPISEALIEQARVYQNQINENNEILRRNASNIGIALTLMGLAPVVAVSAGVVVYFGFDKFDKLLTAIQSYLRPSRPSGPGPGFGNGPSTGFGGWMTMLFTPALDQSHKS